MCRELMRVRVTSRSRGVFEFVGSRKRVFVGIRIQSVRARRRGAVGVGHGGSVAISVIFCVCMLFISAVLVAIRCTPSK